MATHVIINSGTVEYQARVSYFDPKSDHRNFRGFCVPGGFYGRPYGFGPRCFIRPTPFGPRRICHY